MSCIRLLSLEIKNETAAPFQKQNGTELAWQIFEAQGSELSGNFFVLIDPARQTV